MKNYKNPIPLTTVLFLFKFDTLVAVHKKTQSTRKYKRFMLTKTSSQHFLHFRVFLEHSIVPDFPILASMPLQSLSSTISLEVFTESLASLSSEY